MKSSWDTILMDGRIVGYVGGFKDFPCITLLLRPSNINSESGFCSREILKTGDDKEKSKMDQSAKHE